jgi:glycosyltransferase involved in cell wall biosynthesis
MMGPSINSLGGVASVVNGYIQAGLFDRWDVDYLNTHVEGTKANKLATALSALFGLLWLLLKDDVALVHIHASERVSFWRKLIYILIALAARRPVVFHLHGGAFIQFYTDRCGRLAKWIVRFVLEKSACVIGLSSQWKSNILGIAPRAKAVSIFNSVSVAPSCNALPQQGRRNILLFLGRLGQGKGTYDLLEAVARVRPAFPDIELQCGGDGELQQVAQWAKELGIEENIKILGWVKGEEKQRLLAEAAVYVLPSYIEGMPMGVLEAMAVGVPVITTTVGGIPDVINSGVDGILIEPGDVDALANAIALLLEDVDMRVKIGMAAKQKIMDCFSAEKILPQLEAVYRSLGAVPLADAKH